MVMMPGTCTQWSNLPSPLVEMYRSTYNFKFLLNLPIDLACLQHHLVPAVTAVIVLWGAVVAFTSCALPWRMPEIILPDI